MAIYSADTTGWNEALRTGQRSASKGLYAEAISIYEKGLEDGRDDGVLLNNLADACLKNGQLDRAEAYARKAVQGEPDEALPQVTLGQILQGQEKHKDAVGCVLKAKEKLEMMAPELRGITFDSIEQLIDRLSTQAKFELAGKDWIRIVYLVKSLIETYQVELGYVKRGVSWEFLEEIRAGSLESVGPSHRRFKQKVGIRGEDASAVARTVGAMATITGSPQVKPGRQTTTRSFIEIPTCWRHSVIRSLDLDTQPGWVPCSRVCVEYMSCAAQAINPDIGFSFSSTLADGAPRCEGVFERIGSGSPGGPRRVEHPTQSLGRQTVVMR